MRILHVPFSYFPDVAGGTEVYVASLARELAGLGVYSAIWAPGSRAQRYAWDGLDVHRSPVPEPTDLDELYGQPDPRLTSTFSRVLLDTQPDLLHLHAFSGVGASLLAAARQRGVPFLFTYHTPSASCLRGTLVRWGRAICDGQLRSGSCASCALQARGVPRPLALTLGHVPQSPGRALARGGRSHRVITALRQHELATLRHASLRDMLLAARAVVAPCTWCAELLTRIGVPAPRLRLCRQGVSTGSTGQAPGVNLRGSVGRPTALQVAFVGRLHPEKGPDLLIRAARALPDAAVAVDLYGLGSSPTRYRSHLDNLLAGDPRICLHRYLPPAEVVPALAGYDVLAVPSRVMETGPLVVLEAFAAGIPVIGSDIGGIAELVRDGVDGLLLPMDSLAAWSAALGRLATDRQEVRRLAAGVRPPRTMAQVAAEMLPIYESALARASRHP